MKMVQKIKKKNVVSAQYIQIKKKSAFEEKDDLDCKIKYVFKCFDKLHLNYSDNSLRIQTDFNKRF